MLTPIRLLDTVYNGIRGVWKEIVMHLDLRKNVADLFLETGQAHHAAFESTDGADPEWPIWYAEHMQEQISDVLETPFTKSQLVYCVMDADFEHAARDPDSDWPEFYATQFVERYAKSPAPEQDKLILYHSSTCPFCHFVIAAIDRLGIDVETREVFEDESFRNELVSARGRATVPVLRIIAPNGDERWMPESRDIVQYLESL
ncbi:MAG: glutaredoxin family protein [Woeseiaceae bacterium]